MFGVVSVLGVTPIACVEGDVSEEELATEDEDEDIDDAQEDRDFCLYLSSPPASDDTDTLVGAADEVESTDESKGGCDLHTFKVTTNAPNADVAHRIEFDMMSMTKPETYAARVWTKSCGMVCGPWQLVSVPLARTGGNIICVELGNCFQLPYRVNGALDLPGFNSIIDVRAGMRVLDGLGNAMPLTITVSE